MKIHYSPYLKQLARNLRKQGTVAEVVLWNHLKAKQLGVAFGRQRPIGNYIVDFYCSSLQLAIEIDGITHEGKEERDNIRQRYLENLGITVLRFLDEDVRKNTAGVYDVIMQKIADLSDKNQCSVQRNNPPTPLC